MLGGAASLMPPAPRRIRIAFLGASHPHASPKVFIAQKSADWDLVGVHEPDAAVMARYAKAGIAALSREQVLGDASIEVIAVESDIPEHAADALAAIEAGKHVHWEKQPAIRLDEFRAVQQLAARTQRLYQIGYMWRHNPAINAALEAARAGWLGEILFVRGTMNTQIGAEMRRALARFPGGQMFDLAGHMIDPMVRLLGRPQRVVPFLRTSGLFADTLRDNTLAVLEWGRVLGTFSTASMHARHSTYRAFEIAGSEGTAVVRPVEPPSLMIDLAKAAGPYRVGTQVIPYSYTRYVDDFIELAAAVRGERKLSVTAEEEFLVQETLLRVSGMEG